jgi:transcription antitermination protein NusB
MSLRRKARECALQMLFQWEMNRDEPRAVQAGYWRDVRAEEKTRRFANDLFEGAVARAGEIAALVAAHSQNWRLERMSAIDRSILLLAAYEIRWAGTPPRVAINEALELAKKFSGQEAAAFINGILDAIARTVPSGE